MFIIPYTGPVGDRFVGGLLGCLDAGAVGGVQDISVIETSPTSPLRDYSGGALVRHPSPLYTNFVMPKLYKR